MESEQSQPKFLSKAETTPKLNKTINQLETVIQELESITVEQLPESPSLETLIQTTEELENMIIAQRKKISPPIPEISETQTISDPDESVSKQLSQEEISSIHIKIPSMRNLIENARSITSKYQKWLIFGLTTLIAIVLIEISLQFFPATSQAMAESTSTQVVTEQPLEKKELDLDSEKNLKVEPKATKAQSEAKENMIPEGIIMTEPASEAATEIEIIAPKVKTPEVETVKTPEVKTPEVKTVKAPRKIDIQFTPEQNFITAIQKQVIKVSNSYEPELLKTIEANFNNSKLLITIDNQWYEFNEARQDKVANEILKRSRQLAFDKVILQNQDGELLARNPVVGNNMVILERENAAK